MGSCKNGLFLLLLRFFFCLQAYNLILISFLHLMKLIRLFNITFENSKILFLLEFFNHCVDDVECWCCIAKKPHVYQRKKNWFYRKIQPLSPLSCCFICHFFAALHHLLQLFFPLRKICFVVNCKTCPRNGEKS